MVNLNNLSEKTIDEEKNPWVKLADRLTERTESKVHQFKVLASERDTYNADAKQYTEEQMGQCNPDPSA